VSRIAAALLLALAACGGGGGGDDGGGDDEPSGNASVFDSSITRVEIEIDYETGEEPYTGQLVGFGDTFDISRTNLERLFGPGKTLELPTSTAGMENIGAVADEELTSNDIIALADIHRDEQTAGSTHAYYVIFVSGVYADGSGPRPSVLGVSLGSSGVLAMFKDTIRTTQTVVPNIEKFVEQSTLVHELGHAAGLVDNGVPLVTQHKDAEHGAHCTNESCVMYWLNEGASDAAEFAQTYITSGDTILFGDECLADVDALTQ
jgi:hypothetical protein